VAVVKEQKEEQETPRLVALQHRDFRLLWLGQSVSIVGTQMQITAVNWHIYNLLRGHAVTLSLVGRQLTLGADALGLGTLGLVRIIPIVFFALVGGMLADTVDRRRLLILTQCLAASVAAILAVLTLAGRDTVAAIYLLTAVGAATIAFDSPARQSLIPNLVSLEHLTNAVSLNSIAMEVGTIAGPALGGLVLGIANPGWVYALNALSFLGVIFALLAMRYRDNRTARPSSGLGWGPLIEGLRFVHGTRIIWGTMLLDFFATFFSSARTMLPIVADQMLHVGSLGYGILSTGQSAGSLLAGLILALRREIPHQGPVLLISVALYGLATALFGISTVFVVSYLLFAVTGAADTISTVIRQTLRQSLTPDRLRGRMTSVNMIFFMGGPQLGELEAGLVASAWGVAVSIITGGLATVILTGFVAWRYPRLRTNEGVSPQPLAA
jgi:MFS family permease